MSRIAAVIAGVGAIVAAATGMGLIIARRLTAPTAERVYDLIVRDVVREGDDLAVVLDHNSRTASPGIYNLWLDGGGWVKLGPVVDEGATTVTRAVVGEVGERDIRAGQRASWSGIYYRDPVDAGLSAEEISISTPVGLAPGWLIRPSESGGDFWAIHIHGLSSPRAGTLRGVQVAAQAGLTSLVVTYRNDGEGPTSGSGRSTLGAAEADDVRAALKFAVDHGAQKVVIFGWSMGAGIALQLVADAEFQGVIDSLILESPVLDWTATINANCARAGWPSWVGRFAAPWLRVRSLAQLAGLEAPIPLNRFNWIDRAAEYSVPTLILHGVDDSSAPYAVSRRLAALRPDLVRLETYQSDHTLTWNSDPDRWRSIVRDWLEERAVPR